jgi:hypothetical protein
MTKILIVPPGASDAPISHGKDSFPPYREDPSDRNTQWLVEVPDHTAEHFCLNGGFQVYEPQMRRRLSGQCVPLIHGDGSAPCSLSFDGDNYQSEFMTLEDGVGVHVLSLPAEGVSEIVSLHGGAPIHPGYSVLSIADHQPPPVHPGKGWELTERNRRLLGQPPLQGGGLRELDIFPSNVKRAQHPDGGENPEREAEILAAEAKPAATEAKAEAKAEAAEARADAKAGAKAEKAKG